MLTAYLQLVRAPGIFTALSNILVGFLLYPEPDWVMLAPLLLSSGLLYSSGMILNDYFDYNTDKTQRPSRPLPSGRIQKRTALVLGITFMCAANAASALVSSQAALVSLSMTGLILLYNTKTKSNAPAGIATLCAIRILNVCLGFSAYGLDLGVVLVAVPLALLIASIGVLGRTETEQTTKGHLPSTFLLGLSAASLLVILPHESYYYLIFFSMLITLLAFSHLRFSDKSSISTQNKITARLLSIILLDATIIAAFSDISYAIVVSALLAPAYFMTRKLYVT